MAQWESGGPQVEPSNLTDGCPAICNKPGHVHPVHDVRQRIRTSDLQTNYFVLTASHRSSRTSRHQYRRLNRRFNPLTYTRSICHVRETGNCGVGSWNHPESPGGISEQRVFFWCGSSVRESISAISWRTRDGSGGELLYAWLAETCYTRYFRAATLAILSDVSIPRCSCSAESKRIDVIFRN